MRISNTLGIPISRSGDATIATSLDLPSTCLARVVLVHPNGILTTYIAATGFRP